MKIPNTYSLHHLAKNMRVRIFILSAIVFVSLSGLGQKQDKLFTKAKENIAKGKYKAALTHLNKCIEYDPLFVEARKEKINLFLSQNQPEKACEEINEMRRWGMMEANEIKCPNCEDKITPTEPEGETMVNEGFEDSLWIEPVYPGGNSALMQDIYATIVYPRDCIENNIEGKFSAQFIVKKDGSISKIKFIQTIPNARSMEYSIYHSILQLKAFTPATYAGEKVNQAMVLPLNFKLQ